MALLLLSLASPANAEVHLHLYDGNPYDRLSIRSTSCPISLAELEIDFGPSAGKIILDTVRGGPGTKDPMPVEVEKGNLKLRPIDDGDPGFTVMIGSLSTRERGIVTMDMDDTAGWWPGPRVSVDGADLIGTVAILRNQQGAARAIFGAGGRATLAEVPGGCAEDIEEPEVLTTPIG